MTSQCVKDGLDELFGDNVSATATATTIVKELANRVAGKVLRTHDAKNIFEHFTAKGGLMPSMISFFNKLGNGTATSADYGSLAANVLDLGWSIAKLAGSKNPVIAAGLFATTLAELIAPFAPCFVPDDPEPPQKDEAERTTSPLIIDMDRNGIATFKIRNGVFFDLDGNGFKEKAAWLNSGDALLAIDLNGNGLIDSGFELFGNNTKLDDGSNAGNGFRALAELDSNDDKIFDDRDQAWSAILLWRDVLNDGVSQPEEISKLMDSGITAISLEYSNTVNVDASGNKHLQVSKVTWANGGESAIEDIWFEVNLAKTVHNSEMQISDELSAILWNLPYVEGFGNVVSLHEAMALNPALLAMVQSYVSSNASQRAAMLNELIYTWTGSNEVDPNSRDPKKIYGHVMDARQLVTLEHLTGSDYMGVWCWGENDPNPHGQAAPKLIAEFNSFADYVAAKISAQIDHPEVFASLFVPVWNETSQQYSTSWDSYNALATKLLSEGKLLELRDLIKTGRALGNFTKSFRSGYELNAQLVSASNAELAVLLKSAVLVGTAGDDRLTGTAENDVISGEEGADTLYGGTGDDHYIFDKNFGADRIYDTAGTDTLIFGSEVVASSIKISRDLTSIYLTELAQYGNQTPNKIQIDNFFDLNGNLAEGAIEQIRFSDGETWSLSDILLKLAPVPTETNDFLYYSSGGNVVNTLGGNDLVLGGGGNDTINGGEGEDEIFGDDGDDYLIGGAGDDTITGGNGNDTYQFAAGFGHDTINNADYSTGRLDKIEFDASITPGMVSAHRVGQDLVLTTPAGDTITVRFHFNDNGKGSFSINQVVFSDGTIWDQNTIRGMVSAGTTGTDVIFGYDDSNDQLQGLGGNDSLYGLGGDDTLEGGAGNDYLSGGGGNDTYVFSAGFGLDQIENSDWTPGRQDKIKFVGIAPNSVKLKRVGNDLVLYTDAANQVTVLNHFAADGQGWYAINEIDFDDGTVWTADAIKLAALQATPGNDVLTGYASNDSISGLGGDDTIKGLDGDDTLDGGDGNDALYGGKGNDALIGGKGDDYLEGGAGDDNYFHARGDGVDTILDDEGKSTVYVSDLPLNELYFRRDGTRLIVRFTSSETDEIRLEHFFNPDTGLSTRGLSVIYGNGQVWDVTAATLDQEVLKSTPGNDHIVGNNLDNTVMASDGDDYISGLAGSDMLSGGNGSDEIYGGLGNDIISGGQGADRLYGDDGDDQLSGDDGDDQVYGGAGIDTLVGGLGNDKLYGDDGDDHLAGDDGDDQLAGGAGNDTLLGSAGNDVLDGGAGVDALTGNTGDDIYIVDDVADQVIEAANEGNDTIRSSVSNTISDNIERLELTGTTNIDATGSSRGDTLVGNSGDNRLIGLDGDDTLQGGAGNDTLLGGVGNDTLDGGSGLDSMSGGVGNDTYVVDRSDDIVIEAAGEGLDTVNSTASEYTLADNVERLVLLAGAGDGTGNALDNELIGNDGANVLAGGAGADRMVGGLGNDTYVVDSTGDVVIENVDEGYDTVVSSISYALGDTLENLTLSGSGDINAMGNDGDNTLIGNAGNNRLDGGVGGDQMSGGAGNDTYIVDSTDDAVSENADEGIDTIERSYETNYILADNVENLILTGSALTGHGNDLDNVITGNAGNNSSLGLDGNDTIYGLAGNDSMWGGEGNDTLYGGIGNDYLDGGNGSDRLEGGDGNDQLGGGAGVDTLIGGLGDDKYVLTLDGNTDIIDNSDGGFDGIFFGSTISKSQLSFKRDGDDLLIIVDANEAQPAARVVNHFLGGNYAIDYVQPSAPGSYYLTTAEINAKVLAYGTGYDTVMDGTESADTSMVGTSGKDWIRGLGGDDQMFGNAGDDLLQGGDGNDYLAGGLGNDNNTGNDRLEGGNGNDTLVGQDGADTLIGGVGNDTYMWDSGFDTIDNTGGGTDILFFPNSIPVTRLTFKRDGNDLLILVDNNPTQGVRVINHFLGGDYALDNVYQNGGSGYNTTQMNQKAAMAGYDNLVQGTSSNETLNGTSGKDLMYGGGGNDIMNGAAGDDRLLGEAGNDTLYGGLGTDKLEGGLGDDIYTIDDTLDLVIENANEGNDLVNASVSYSLTDNVERLTLTGTSANNGTGNALDNVLTGNAGNNTLTGGAGNDILDGGLGNDALIGGVGDDTYVVNATGDVVTEAANEGIDTVKSGVTYTLGSNVENLTLTGTTAINGIGNALDNILIGNSGNNTLTGNAGNDILEGGAGTDTLTGGAGNDTYLMGRGYGADSVVENDTTGGNFDVASFLSGIAYDQLWFQKPTSTNDLKISIIGTSDSLTIKSWYSGSQYQVEKIQTADGYSLTAAKVQTLVTKMASMTKPTGTTLTSSQRSQLASTFASTWTNSSQLAGRSMGMSTMDTQVVEAFTPDSALRFTADDVFSGESWFEYGEQSFGRYRKEHVRSDSSMAGRGATTSPELQRLIEAMAQSHPSNGVHTEILNVDADTSDLLSRKSYGVAPAVRVGEWV